MKQKEMVVVLDQQVLHKKNKASFYFSKELTKYLLKELFLFFILSFLFFFFVFFVNQILLMAQDILKKRAPVADVIKLIVFSLPFVIAQAAPFATLVGFLMCLGKLVSDNEILVIRASGFSYIALAIPVFSLGLLISIFSFAVNDYLLPMGSIAYNKLYSEIIFANPAIIMEPNSIKRTNDAVLIVGDLNDSIVSDLLIIDKDSDSNTRIISSRKTKMLKPESKSILIKLEMNLPEIFSFDTKNLRNYNYSFGSKAIFHFFADRIFPRTSGVNPREMTSYDLKKELNKIREKNKDKRNYELTVYEIEYYKKFSLPFGAFFFSLLALPLAFLFGKHNGQTIGLIIGILLSVLYWALLIMGQTYGAQTSTNGFIVMWFPNAIMGLAGLILLFWLVKK